MTVERLTFCRTSKLKSDLKHAPGARDVIGEQKGIVVWVH